MNKNPIYHDQEKDVQGADLDLYTFPTPDPTIKISAALREAAKQVVQIQMGFWEGEVKYDPETRLYEIPCFTGACALGAACLAVTSKERQLEFLNATDDDELLIWATLPGLDDEVTPPSSIVLNSVPYYLGGLMVALNDEHGWTFDQIADYLESIGR